MLSETLSMVDLLREPKGVSLYALASLNQHASDTMYAHVRRVREFSVRLARRLSEKAAYRDVIDGEFIRLLGGAVCWHDIGKLSIPPRLLDKPGKLTGDEFAIVQLHAELGATFLHQAFNRVGLDDLGEMAREVALHHHERWDGKGYPARLKAGEIPLCARIVAVCDVYDALTSQRVYKQALPHRLAVEIIRESSGTHFDPLIVEAFLELADSWEAVAEVTASNATTAATSARTT